MTVGYFCLEKQNDGTNMVPQIPDEGQTDQEVIIANMATACWTAMAKLAEITNRQIICYCILVF